MDKEKVRKALDAFEDDKFTDSQEILQKELRGHFKDAVYKKLDLAIDQPDEEPAVDDPAEDE